MATPNTSPASPPAARVLALVPGGRRPLDRDARLSRARDARRQLQPRPERFAHLKRSYD